MSTVLVLGAGMVGRAIALDLAQRHKVSSADINLNNLKVLNSNSQSLINVVECDLSDSNLVKKLVPDFDIVVSAVPGFMGYKTLQAIIEAGKNVVDIAFFSEDAFGLDELAKDNKVTAIVDCGVAPGMSNLFLGYHSNKMNVTDFKCYVGGLPFSREFPFQYKAPFSPVDVIEEYTRPARYVENGHLVVKPALSDAEYLSFEKVGTLEAFNSDGLRSLIKTINTPNMIEKTLRYPGHIEYIKVLKECGFFGEEEIEVKGMKIRPIDFTTSILFNKWKLNDEDDEFIIMRIEIKGNRQGIEESYIYDLFDQRDKISGISSMARTTGYTACAAVELVLNGQYSIAGISPPEFLGKEESCFISILTYLAERNIKYHVLKQ